MHLGVEASIPYKYSCHCARTYRTEKNTHRTLRLLGFFSSEFFSSLTFSQVTGRWTQTNSHEPTVNIGTGRLKYETHLYTNTAL